MSVLVLGADKIDSIKNLLYGFGINDVIHWNGRKLKSGRKKSKAIPSKVDIILMITDFLNHNTMKYYKTEAKFKGIEVVYAKRSVECVKSEFIKRFANLNSESLICKNCSEYNKCYEK